MVSQREIISIRKVMEDVLKRKYFNRREELHQWHEEMIRKIIAEHWDEVLDKLTPEKCSVGYSRMTFDISLEAVPKVKRALNDLYEVYTSRLNKLGSTFDDLCRELREWEIKSRLAIATKKGVEMPDLEKMVEKLEVV